MDSPDYTDWHVDRLKAERSRLLSLADTHWFFGHLEEFDKCKKEIETIDSEIAKRGKP